MLLAAGAEWAKVAKENQAVTERLLNLVRKLRVPLTLPLPNYRPGEARRGKVRFVSVSDTHRKHSYVYMPEGDVLLHNGDFSGNYNRKQNLYAHLQSFCAWLIEMSKKYRDVVFIAGNHDTQLDESFDHRKTDVRNELVRRSRALVASLPPNVHYLENSATVVFGGIRVFGSPVTPCRLEAMGSHYLSAAFETKIADRRRLFGALAEAEILMTHGPPESSKLSAFGDRTLAHAVRKMRTPPLVHCFGHDHDYPGVQQVQAGGRIVTRVNTAQKGLLGHYYSDELEAGKAGVAWVFDLEARSQSSL